MAEKMRALFAFTKKHLRPYGCRGGSFTAAVNSVYGKPYESC